jgi:hypothetical protein
MLSSVDSRKVSRNVFKCSNAASDRSDGGLKVALFALGVGARGCLLIGAKRTSVTNRPTSEHDPERNIETDHPEL